MSHETLVDAVESSLEVKRRYQFFIWTQSRLNAVIPHQLAICGAYHRAQRQLAFDVFNSVVMEAELLSTLTDPRGPFQQPLQAQWLAGDCKPLALDLERVPSGPSGLVAEALRRSGLQGLLAHGVSRPQRPTEIETFFVLGLSRTAGFAEGLSVLGLLTPHLHAAWLRVLQTESEVGADPLLTQRSATRPRAHGITGREKQILCGLREGQSNLQIGEQLGISPLTVKNHVQKILRKLDASNRAQAVARALALQLLDNQLPEPFVIDAPYTTRRKPGVSP